MSSGSKIGCSSNICSFFIPESIISIMSNTVNLMALIVGFPPINPGTIVIRFNNSSLFSISEQCCLWLFDFHYGLRGVSNFYKISVYAICCHIRVIAWIHKMNNFLLACIGVEP